MNIVRSFAPLLLTALLLFAVGKLHLDGWIAISVMQIVAIGIGLSLAMRMKTRFAFMVLSVLLVPIAVELAAHLIWGIRAVQSGPTHLSIFAAAAGGVLLGLVTKMAGANAV